MRIPSLKVCHFHSLLLTLFFFVVLLLIIIIRFIIIILNQRPHTQFYDGLLSVKEQVKKRNDRFPVSLSHWYGELPLYQIEKCRWIPRKVKQVKNYNFDNLASLCKSVHCLKGLPLEWSKKNEVLYSLPPKNGRENKVFYFLPAKTVLKIKRFFIILICSFTLSPSYPLEWFGKKLRFYILYPKKDRENKTFFIFSPQKTVVKIKTFFNFLPPKRAVKIKGFFFLSPKTVKIKKFLICSFTLGPSYKKTILKIKFLILCPGMGSYHYIK